MTVRAEPEQIETTGSEKALALVLIAFILIGGIWTYFKLDEVDQPATSAQLHAAAGSAADRAAVGRHGAAQRAVRTAERFVEESRQRLELKREAFRTALDAGEPATGLRSEYAEARRDLAAAAQGVREATQQAAATAGSAGAAERRIALARQQAERRMEDDRRSHDRLVLALRLLLVLLMLGAGYWLLSTMRSRRSRYLPLALAEIGAAAGLAVLMAVDYATDYIEVADFGLLALSLVGTAMTVIAFVALQRYIAKRIPARRVRRHDCPFCGFPVRGNANCEGCGRRVVGECSACHEPRRVGAEHCGACGAA